MKSMFFGIFLFLISTIVQPIIITVNQQLYDIQLNDIKNLIAHNMLGDEYINFRVMYTIIKEFLASSHLMISELYELLELSWKHHHSRIGKLIFSQAKQHLLTLALEANQELAQWIEIELQRAPSRLSFNSYTSRPRSVLSYAPSDMSSTSDLIESSITTTTQMQSFLEVESEEPSRQQRKRRLSSSDSEHKRRATDVALPIIEANSRLESLIRYPGEDVEAALNNIYTLIQQGANPDSISSTGETLIALADQLRMETLSVLRDRLYRSLIANAKMEMSFM